MLKLVTLGKDPAKVCVLKNEVTLQEPRCYSHRPGFLEEGKDQPINTCTILKTAKKSLAATSSRTER